MKPSTRVCTRTHLSITLALAFTMCARLGRRVELDAAQHGARLRSAAVAEATPPGDKARVAARRTHTHVREWQSNAMCFAVDCQCRCSARGLTLATSGPHSNPAGPQLHVDGNTCMQQRDNRAESHSRGISLYHMNIHSIDPLSLSVGRRGLSPVPAHVSPAV